MCKHHPMVVFHILLWNVIICFSIARISLSIFAFAHCQAAHSSVFQLFFFIIFPMFLFLANDGGGITYFHLFDILKVLLSSHILSSMRQINVYLIIDSNVFSVKIGEIFPLAIVK
jgi:hypothetical protein